MQFLDSSQFVVPEPSGEGLKEIQLLSAEMKPALREECGVVGVWRPKGALAAVIGGAAIAALVHRGQDGCGGFTRNLGEPGEPTQVKSSLIVTEYFTSDFDYDRELPGNAGIFHCRYGTSGEQSIANIQPLSLDTERFGKIALVHNGNLVNAEVLRRSLENDFSVKFNSSSDSEIILQLINLAPFDENSDNPARDAVKFACKHLPGSYSAVLMFADRMFAVRDPMGNRPLSIAEAKDGSILIVSEDSAIPYKNLHSLRDVTPGEIIEISSAGNVSGEHFAVANPHHCSVENLYLAARKSIIFGISNQKFRQDLGMFMASQLQEQGLNLQGYAVVPLPNSALLPGFTFARELGLEIAPLLQKVRGAERTFIAREAHRWRTKPAWLAYLKHNIITEGNYHIHPEHMPASKKIVLLDDSIVRGNTIKEVVPSLIVKGVTDFHIVSVSPKFIGTCNKGVRISDLAELIAHRAPTEDLMAKELLAEINHLKAGLAEGINITFHFLELRNFKAAFGDTAGDMCYACMGEPDPISPEDLHRNPLELTCFPGKVGSAAVPL